MAGKWPRGSEWRMWDLHIHAPGTKLNDNFKAPKGSDVWNEYCARLERSDVHAFGITDYFSAGGFLATAREFRARYPNSKKVIFPNIELRTNDVVNAATEEVNIHLIFNPFQPGFERSMESFLQHLKTHKTQGAGRKNVAASELGGHHRFDEATTSRDFIHDALANVYGKGAMLTDHVLIVTAANNDGIRAPRGKRRKAVISDELDKCSHGFLGNSSNCAWYLKPDRYEDKNELSHPKPTLSGCDAHSLEALDESLGKTLLDGDNVLFEPTWIKADLTYDGLKQIMYEPENRVHIGGTAPLDHDEARVIKSVRLSSTHGWFEEHEIPLNAGLVSIIGQKGSGKSALAELMAYAAGSWNTADPASFLARAGDLIEDLTVTLTWADNKMTTHRIGDPQTNDGKVRYLSQKFVERLCAVDGIGDELVREIEAVIFSHTDPTDTLNASNFEELRAKKTESLTAARDQVREDISRLIREDCQLEENSSKVPAKRTRIKTLREEEAGLVKQMPKPASEAEKKVQVELAERRAALGTAQGQVAALKQKSQKIADIKSRVTAFKGSIRRFVTEIEPLLKDAGIPEADRARFKPSFAQDTDEPLTRRERELGAEISAKEGKEDNPAAGTIRAIQKQIEMLAAKESNDKAQQLRIKNIQTRTNEINTEVKRLEAEITQIEGLEKARRQACRVERLTAYGDYFETLKDEQAALEALYQPVKKRLGGGAESDLEFSIRRDVDIEKWLQRGGLLLDQRRNNPHGSFEDLSNAARRILLPAWASGDAARIKEAHKEFMEPFRGTKAAEYVRKDVTLKDVREWLYETDHVKLSYGLKYKGTELEKLSPGTKGIVLLILYLGLDTADTRPLVVDQPDENLDNESIYAMLRSYFEKAKSRRQIILISHNPNLVVNADSEQIVVATCEKQANGLPHIRYESGSMEHSVDDGSGIRQRVCRILEGGAVAFQRRENRYDIPKKVPQGG